METLGAAISDGLDLLGEGEREREKRGECQAGKYGEIGGQEHGFGGWELGICRGRIGEEKGTLGFVREWTTSAELRREHK